jgi:hypothetical protein
MAKLYFVYLYSPAYDGARGVAVGLGTALPAGRSRVWFPVVLLEFFIDIILPDAASNRNEYQEYFLELKVAGL